jgi:protein-disulfide isomerase
MKRSIRSIPALLARAAATSILASLALAPACAEAPDQGAPRDEAIAPEPGARAPEAAGRAATHTQKAPAAEVAAPAPEGAECDPDPKECDCAGKEVDAVPEDAPIERVAIDGAPIRGAVNAPVTIVVFSDLECPFCAKVWTTLHQIEEEYPGKVRFAFKHRPLPFHQHARLAAKAARAAQAQGRFWEFHDALLAAHEPVDEASLERRASEVGLDVARFRQAMRSDEVDAAVAADDEEGTRLGLKGTPTLFVNGRRIIGAQPIDVIRASVDRALASR